MQAIEKIAICTVTGMLPTGSVHFKITIIAFAGEVAARSDKVAV
jgi:hypothetical protein